jgi:hypothetical protein
VSHVKHIAACYSVYMLAIHSWYRVWVQSAWHSQRLARWQPRWQVEHSSAGSPQPCNSTQNSYTSVHVLCACIMYGIRQQQLSRHSEDRGMQLLYRLFLQSRCYHKPSKPFPYLYNSCVHA